MRVVHDCDELSYLNPTDLVLHKIDQEPISNLPTTVFDLFQKRRLRRFERSDARVFKSAAKHLQSQRDVPQIPDIIGVNRELTVSGLLCLVFDLLR